MAPTELGVCLLLVAMSGVVVTRAEAADEGKSAPSAVAPLQVDPDAEGTANGGDTSARFLFKKNRRRYNQRYPNYDYNYYYDYNNNNGYDYSSQCQSCGYGAVDYTTARRCCQQGYSNCCFDNNSNGEVKPGTCSRTTFGSVGSSYCRSECSGDTDCYGTQKCCRQGCSRTCQYPDTGSSYEKPGSCPFRGSRGSSYPSFPYYTGSTVGSTYCRRDCYNDQQCPSNQKCCESNCSATCVSPQYYY